MDRSSCPESNVLRLLVERGGQGPEVDGIARHLEECESCGATVESLLASDPTLAGLGQETIVSLETESAFQRLKERLRQLRPAADVARAEFADATVGLVGPPPEGTPVFEKTEVGLSFLTPPQGPGELGRLGNYRILRLLGSGGMGMVFQAHDTQLERLVALKVMKPSANDPPAAKTRFTREARACAALTHDHIVTVFQVGEANGVPFLAMEYLEGSPLDVRLNLPGLLDTPTVLRIGREIAKGLAAAHAKGLIHRDIKPGNIWLDQNSGRVKILDFGLARGQGDNVNLTQSGTIVGTPAYMAPEQARGEKVDPRCDLFSLGCVLYRLAAGRVPFSGDSTLSILTALAVDTPQPVKEINPQVPAALSDLIARLLAKKPADRPESAAVVVQELEAIERSLARAEPTAVTEPAPARDSEPSPQPSRARAGRRWPLALAAAGLAAVLLAGWVIIRDKDGKEVGRHKIPDKGSAEFRPEPQELPVPQEPLGKEAKIDPAAPFVLVRDGKPARAYKTFAGLLAELENGDAIEIHGNGPFKLPRIQLNGKALTLRAAPGYRPRLVPTDDLAADKASCWIAVTGAPVSLTGCDFECPPCDFPALLGEQGNWEIRNCRVFKPGSNTGVLLAYRGPWLRVADCLFTQNWSHNGIFIGAGADVEFDNTIYWSRSYALLQAEAGGGQTIRLRNTTFVGACLLSLLEGLDKPVTVVAENSYFNVAPVVRSAMTLEQLKEKLRWQGSYNLYVTDGNAFIDAGGEKPLVPVPAVWQKFWGDAEKGTRAASRRALRYDSPARLPATGALQYLREYVGTLRQRHGEPMKNVGPDWDLVGPGDAYLKALAATGKPVAKTDLRPEALEGGVFVLLRQGKPVRGYLQLSEAVEAAADGDTIEIRSDAPQNGVWRPLNKGKPLTLRAAPGYRPTLDQIMLGKGDLWNVEGIHFKAGVHTVPGGAVARLANCSFSMEVDRRNVVLATTGDVEISNCLIPGTLELLASMRQPRITNSIVGWLYTPVEQPPLQLERAVMWYPEAYALDWYKPPLTVSARGCLFETNRIVRHPPEVPLQWSGDGNAFCTFGHFWLWEGDAKPVIYDLAGWRQRFGSDATSLVAEPVVHDPRQFRVLPGHPGHQAGPGGKDLGADVERIATVTVDPKVSPKIDQARPFVLVRGGKPERAFQSLGGALNETKTGDVIEIHANGPLSLAGVERIDKPLTLRNGAGFRPWLVVREIIQVDNVSLDIEGCDFDARGAFRLFQGSGESWQFRHCRFWGANILSTGATRMRVADSLALGATSFLLPGPDGTAELDNCLTNMSLAVVHAGERATILLKDSSFVLSGFGGPSVVRPLGKSCRIEARGNLVLTENSHYNGPLGHIEPKFFTWQGQENLYAGRWTYQSEKGEVWASDLASWNKLWEKPDADSRETAELSLEWSRPSGFDWAATRALYQPLVLASQQRHGLAELGPDWDLIGPGAAYIKALEQVAGQPLAKERWRPEVPDGKPYVLLRGGQLAGSYRVLQEAANAAQDGDVIELRTDGPCAQVGFRGKGRHLTLRAAPGYAPVVQYLDGASGEDWLSLEGLSFLGKVGGTRTLGGGQPGFAEGGGIHRLANCFIPAECYGVFRGVKGQPAEVVNCWIGPLRAGLEEQPLRVTNSVLRGLNVDTIAGKPAVTVERCVLANSAPGFPQHSALGVTPVPNVLQLTMQVRRSYIQSPDLLVFARAGLSWEGAGNVYQVPRNYFYGIRTDSLDFWRTRFKSDADSFEERPTQLDPLQWRIRADSPGYVKRKDGRDFGADVSRILAPPPSPLDALRRQDIPALELANAGDGNPDQAPPELVAVLGDSRWTSWGGTTFGGLSDDGTRIAGGWDGMARVWDVSTGRIIRGISTRVQSFPALSPDGKTLAIAGDAPDYIPTMWDVDSGTLRLRLSEAANATYFQFSPDGRLVLAWPIRKGELGALDAATGQLLGNLRLVKHRNQVAFSPDGRWVVVPQEEGKVLITAADLSGVPRVFEAGAAAGNVLGAAVSLDGKSLVAATFADKGTASLHLWDLGSGELKRSVDGVTMPANHGSIDLRFEADNDHVRLVTASALAVWEAKGVRVLADMKCASTGVQGRWNFSRAGQLLVGRSWYFGNGLVMRDAAGAARAGEPEHRGPWLATALSPDQRLLIAGGGGALRAWDLPASQPRWLQRQAGLSFSNVGFSTDGKSVWTAGSPFPLQWDALTGASPVKTPQSVITAAITASADGKMVVGLLQGKILVSTGSDAPPRTLGEHDAVSVAVSRDGRWAASGGTRDGTVKLWDLTAGQAARTITLPGGAAYGLAFSPDGGTLAVGLNTRQTGGGAGGEICLYQVADSREIRTMPGHPFHVGTNAVAFSPDGQTLASVGADRAVRLWDVASGALKREIALGPGGRGWVHGVTWAADGRHLVTANGNGTVYVLRLAER